MILDAIFDFILFIPNTLLDNFIGLNISIPNDVFDWFKNVINLLVYVFPIKAILPIFVLSILLKVFQTNWALVNKIKGWIPTMSD